MDVTSYPLPACLAEDFPGFKGDGTEACAKLQFDYELLSGKVEALCVQHARLSDKAFAVQKLETLQGEIRCRYLKRICFLLADFAVKQKRTYRKNYIDLLQLN